MEGAAVAVAPSIFFHSLRFLEDPASRRFHSIDFCFTDAEPISCGYLLLLLRSLLLGGLLRGLLGGALLSFSHSVTSFLEKRIEAAESLSTEKFDLIL